MLRSRLVLLTFGFFGIQFGFALQNANLSRVFETLGADLGDLPLLWLAAPLTGILMQPLIGHWSDRSLSRFGRRRPFVVVGAVLSGVALVALPYSSTLAMAVLFVWLLDASINACMEPLRTLVADSTDEQSSVAAFAWQSFFIALGSVIGSLLPWVVALVVPRTGSAVGVGPQVQTAFWIGAVLFVGSVVASTVASKDAPLQQRPPRVNYLRSIGQAMARLKPQVWLIGSIQFCAWFGLFVVWVFTTPAVAQAGYGDPAPGSAAYQEAADWVGLAFSAYNATAAVFSLFIARLNRRLGGHLLLALSLGIGGLALLAWVAAPTMEGLLVAMALFGPAWATILSLPYSLAKPHLPAQSLGLHFGLLNLFIVVPQIISSLVMGPVMEGLFRGWALGAMLVAGGFFAAAAVLAVVGWRKSTQTIVH